MYIFPQYEDVPESILVKLDQVTYSVEATNSIDQTLIKFCNDNFDFC